MKTTQDIVEEMLLQGKHINKFDLLSVANSVCLAQRILDIREQKGWNIQSKSVPGKGTLKEYWLEPEEIARIREKTQRIERLAEEKKSDEQLVEENKNLAEMASESLKNEEKAYEIEQLGIGILGGRNYG